MKTESNLLRKSEALIGVGHDGPAEGGGLGLLRAAFPKRRGFTLIELLVVIAIMGILAAFTLVVVGGLKKTSAIKTATAEMGQIESALEDYKNKYGTYPPCNPQMTPLENTLYYELTGVTFDAAKNTYTTLDSAASILQTDYKTAFTASGSSIDGIVNCTKGDAEEGTTAKDFLEGLKANRIGTSASGGISISNLVTSVRGPDADYKPLGVQDVNPFRYLFPGTNNPNSYDLWVQLKIGGKTNLICNWTKNVIVNSPLP